MHVIVYASVHELMEMNTTPGSLESLISKSVERMEDIDGTIYAGPVHVDVRVDEEVPDEDVVQLDLQERSTVLAALRYYQAGSQGDPSFRSDMIHDIATCGDECISLDDEGIDELCEKLNS